MPNVVGDKCNTCQPGFLGYPSCQEGFYIIRFPFLYDIVTLILIFNVEEKILIASGFNDLAYPHDDIRESEIIDVEDPNFSCTKVDPFPETLVGATGGLMNGQIPFICGGSDDDTYSKDCYQLTDTGSWARDQRATLSIPRGGVGTGTVVLNNSLILTGGYSGLGYLASIEMLSPNATAQTLSVQLPTGTGSHCQVSWDSETFLVIGGFDDFSDKTYFINVKTQQRTNGPYLNTARYDHGCGEIQLKNGKAYIIVTGGHYWNYLRSTEVLDKSNVGQGWQIGKNLK